MSATEKRKSELMQRRVFNQTLLGIGGTLFSRIRCKASTLGLNPVHPISQISENQLRKDSESAPPYPKPKGLRNGFDGLNMHEVLQVKRQPAVRVKLKMAGKPQAAQLSDGTIIVAGFIEPPVHPESRCTLQYSCDNGKTFSQPRVLDLPGRTEGFKALKNNTLILAHAGRISRSTNRGLNWTTFEFPEDFVPGKESFKLGECHGPIELPDGTLMVSLVRTVGHYQWAAYVIRSTDDGKTWGNPTPVPTATDADEISYAYLSSGKILGIARTSAAFIRREGLQDLIPGSKGAPIDTEAGDSSFSFYSDDKGQTWSHPKPTGLGVLQAAGGYPLPLADGRILLLHGNRVFPYGTQVVGSRNLGKTWDLNHPIFLSWHSWSGYCGHPRSVQLQDGTILTGYYTHRIDIEGPDQVDTGRNAPLPHHNQECTGELIRWRVPDDWPPNT